MGGLLNPGAVTRRRSTFNTNSGGPSVNLTPEQQARISGTGIGSALGVTPAPAGSNPFTLVELSQGINDGSITNQGQVDAAIASRGYSGNTVQNRVSGASSTPLSSPASGGGSNPSNPALGGGSDGSNFGSVGGGYNTGGTTRFDSAGNVIIGTMGGRNIIRGATDVDRTAGVNGGMNMFDPSYWVNREQDIRRQVERERQGQIDAINKKYESQVSEEQAQGEQDLARMRSMNLRAGLGGSSFGAANKIGVREQTQKNVAAIQANQDIAVGEVIDKIETIANQRYQNEFTTSNQLFQNQMAYAQFQQTQQDSARTLVKELGASGLDMSSIKQKDPQLYANIISSTGLGEVAVEAMMNASKKKAEQVDYQYKYAGGKLVAFGINPLTGTMSVVEQDIDLPENYEIVTMDDGTAYGKPEMWDGKPSSLIPLGNYAKPDSGGGGYSNQMLDNERALMTAFKGEPIVKNYNDVLNKKMSVDAIIEGGMSGPADLALVFEFMKALDPTSVVREAEYEAAAKSGNIFAGAWTRFNKGYFDPDGGMLPQNVKDEFQRMTNSKLDVATTQYENLANEYSAVAARQGLDPRNVVLGYNNASDNGYTGTNEEQVMMRSPDGTMGYVPKSQVQQALSEGFHYPQEMWSADSFK